MFRLALRLQAVNISFGVLVLTAFLLSCTAPPPSINQSQPAPKQTSHGLSASVSYEDQCADLHQSGSPISMSFAMCTDLCWGFDFFPQPNLPKDDEFAWLCGRLDFVDTNVRLEALVSPEDYQALLASFDSYDFFDLPAEPASSTMPHAPQYIIEATRDSQKHRVTMREDAAVKSLPEFQRFQAVWNALNTILPEPLKIALTP